MFKNVVRGDDVEGGLCKGQPLAHANNKRGMDTPRRGKIPPFVGRAGLNLKSSYSRRSELFISRSATAVARAEVQDAFLPQVNSPVKPLQEATTNLVVILYLSAGERQSWQAIP